MLNIASSIVFVMMCAKSSNAKDIILIEFCAGNISGEFLHLPSAAA